MIKGITDSTQTNTVFLLLLIIFIISYSQKTYESPEEQMNGSTDSLSSNRDLTKDNDELMETPDKTSIKFKKFLYKKLNKINEKQRNFEPPEYNMKKSNSMPMISERWQRLPTYNQRRVQISRADNDWLRALEREQQANDGDDFI